MKGGAFDLSDVATVPLQSKRNGTAGKATNSEDIAGISPLSCCSISWNKRCSTACTMGDPQGLTLSSTR